MKFVISLLSLVLLVGCDAKKNASETEVESLSDLDPKTHHELTASENHFFAQKPHLIAYYFNLQKFGAAGIEKEFGLSESDQKVYLEGLLESGFIEVTEDGQIRDVYAGKSLSWSEDSELGLALRQSTITNFSKRALSDHLQGKDVFVEHFGFVLTEAEKKALQEDLKKVLIRYFKKRESIDPSQEQKEKLIQTSILILGVDEFQLDIFDEIKPIDQLNQ